MTRKEQLYYLLDNYKRMNYTAASFCDQFVEIYSTNANDESMTDEENKFMYLFCRLAERFSPYNEDLQLNHYFVDEKTFRRLFEELYNCFRSDGTMS